ncbi:hypothetical protein LOK49_LG10G01353 [Camellia lanceoleosa]|uniref:Uncharacterized protein n=1 Tax=Camellia lanceoleosa TaxID=1840588 RepID=A0ACC0G759_9ERIC|nr:hypothetical protein LOK49_LG10G01353 [Camellia lanceoleosa]
MHIESEHLSKRRRQVHHVQPEVAGNGVEGGVGGEVGSVAEEDDDDDVAQNDDVLINGTHTADTALVAVDGGHHGMSGAVVKVTQRALGKQKVVPAACTRSVENGTKQRVPDLEYNNGVMNSLTGLECGRPNINLEVVLHGAQLQLINNGPRWEVNSNLSDCIAQSQFMAVGEAVAQTVNHEKEGPFQQVHDRSKRKSDLKRKGSEQGKDRVKQGGQPKQKGILFSNCLKSGAVLRAAAATKSLQASQTSSSQRRRNILKEAHDTIEVGKALGLNCEGKEEEVVAKIMELEEKDLERIEGMTEAD